MDKIKYGGLLLTVFDWNKNSKIDDFYLYRDFVKAGLVCTSPLYFKGLYIFKKSVESSQGGTIIISD